VPVCSTIGADWETWKVHMGRRTSISFMVKRHAAKGGGGVSLQSSASAVRYYGHSRLATTPHHRYHLLPRPVRGQGATAKWQG